MEKCDINTQEFKNSMKMYAWKNMQGEPPWRQRMEKWLSREPAAYRSIWCGVSSISRRFQEGVRQVLT